MKNMNNERSVAYSKKIVIFFDILGFKDLIENNINTPGLIDDVLRTAYLSSEQPFNGEIINFSDTIIQIFEPSRDLGGDETSDFASYINNLLDAVQRVQNTLLLRYKVVIRGAMVLGDIYYNQDTNTIFGPALNKAAGLEKLASTPRVILDDSIVEKLNVKDHEETVFLNYSIDDDGLYYADPFQYMAKTKYEQSTKLPQLKTKVEEIISEIKDRSIEKEEKEKILDKYNWLIKKIEKREKEDLVAARERLNK